LARVVRHPEPTERGGFCGQRYRLAYLTNNIRHRIAVLRHVADRFFAEKVAG
jgi:hypothetical protein